MKNYFKEQKAITLIALVITIIVLLILAGVAISMLAGDNGILRQAAKAKKNTEEASYEEGLNLSKQELYIAIEGKLSTEKVEKAGFELKELQDKEGNIIRYIATKDVYGHVVDTKGSILASSSKKIVDDIYNIANEYTTSTDILNFSSILPYGNDEETINNTKEQIDYYTEEISREYKIGIAERCLICLQNEVMTKEKIEVCESMNIYLAGDLNKDHVFDWWDIDEVSECMNCTVVNRKEILCDVNQNGRVDAGDILMLSKSLYNLYQEEVNYLQSIYEEYEYKHDEGEITEEMNATSEEIQNYITLYKEELSPYKLIMRKGVLYWVYDKTKKYAPRYISNSNIYIYIDINKDNKINETDITYIQRKIDRSDYDERADLNNDGVLNEKDIKLYREIIS